MSLNANPIATLLTPSAPNSDAAFKVGNTTVTATESPIARMTQVTSLLSTSRTPRG